MDKSGGGEVERLMEIVTGDLRDHEKRITSLENRATVVETDMRYVKDDLKTIKENTTWTFRLVVGSLVVGALGGLVTLFFKVVAS